MHNAADRWGILNAEGRGELQLHFKCFVAPSDLLSLWFNHTRVPIAYFTFVEMIGCCAAVCHGTFGHQ